ncbi:MAG TPA: hypothetical protein VNO30_30860 [Kofleriaceae bacterium]|nr:hypothetical protein [Kofleriaceae bacterium]
MRREIREVDLLDLSRPPAGTVAPWTKWVIGCAAILAIAVAVVASRAIWRMDGVESTFNAFWFQYGLALVSAAAIAAVLATGERGGQAVRLAAFLPIILLAGMLVAWGAWELISPRLTRLRQVAPLVRDVPILAVVVVTAAALTLCVLAAAPRGRGRGTWMRAAVVISLVDLLLLGLWLPLVSWWWSRHAGITWDWEAERDLLLGSVPRLLGLALAPPLLAATAFAALALRWPALALRLRGLWSTALLLGFTVAVVARLGDTERGYLVYLNLVHFLAASAFLAAAALVGLVGSLVLRDRSARRRLSLDGAAVTGVIPEAPEDRDGESNLVACLELEGWLAGPRALVDAFEVATPAGRVPIPAGAELAAQLPPVSTVLHAGESVAVLRRGDRVVVGGLVVPPADHPFRSAGALIPGPDGIVVRRHDDQGDGFASIALVAWRPCVAYLLILSAVAIPGLVAALTLL